MPMNFSVKWQHDGQFRRFSVDVADNANAYDALKAKIQTLVPGFDKPIAWKDGEGDMITFSTDAETREAIRESDSMLLRIYTIDEQQPKSTAGTDESVNVGVGVPIGVPVRLPFLPPFPPLKTTKVDEQTKETPKNPEEVEHPNIYCDGCDSGYIRGVRHKCMVCPDYDLCSHCEHEGKHREHPMIRISDPHDHSWKPFVWRYRHRHNRPMPPAAPFGGFSGSGGRGRRCGWGQRRAHSDAYTQGMEYLQQVGKSVAEALSDFGIDVDVDVEHGGQREKVAKTGDEPKQQQQQPSAAQEPEKKTDEASAPAATGQEQTRVVPVLVEQDTMEVDKQPSAPAKENTPESEDGNQDWTVLNKPPTVEAPSNGSQPLVQLLEAQPASSQATRNLYPNMGIERQIEETLEALKNMGFNDDGGWLKALVEVKKGDINEVLNQLQPRTGN